MQHGSLTKGRVALVIISRREKRPWQNLLRGIDSYAGKAFMARRKRASKHYDSPKLPNAKKVREQEPNRTCKPPNDLGEYGDGFPVAKENT